MNSTIRKTRACTIETLDEKLRDAIRSHGTEYGLQDLETDVLMCCETLSAWQRKGFQGGIRTSLSAVYVTPKWLVWAEVTHDQQAMAGTAQLKNIEIGSSPGSAGYNLSEQGLHVRGRHTRKDHIETTFLLLDSGAQAGKFRQILREALLASQ